jgi:predicted TPR repeat methyltransferase
MQSPSENALEYYDRHSEEYVSKWARSEATPAGAYRAETIRNLVDVARVREGSRVVEIGAGTGLVLRELLSRTRPIVATDISIEMLRRAQESLGAEHRVAIVEALPADPWHGAEDVLLLQNDLMALELPAGGFDAILAMEVLRYVRDLERALGNIAAIMDDETIFAFTVTNLWSAGLFPLKYRLRRRLGRVDDRDELLQYFVTERRLLRALDRAGLRPIELRKLHCIAFNPLARRLVRTSTGAQRVLAVDRRLASVPVVNRCFDTLLVAVTRR